MSSFHQDPYYLTLIYDTTTIITLEPPPPKKKCKYIIINVGYFPYWFPSQQLGVVHQQNLRREPRRENAEMHSNAKIENTFGEKYKKTKM